jgi:hypothetical protein
LESGYSLFPVDGGKLSEELVHRLPSLEIVEERLNRNPCSNEDGGPPHHIVVYGYDRFGIHNVDSRVI